MPYSYANDSTNNYAKWNMIILWNKEKIKYLMNMQLCIHAYLSMTWIDPKIDYTTSTCTRCPVCQKTEINVITILVWCL